MSLVNALISLHDKFAKTTLVESFQDSYDDSITFRVIDRKMPLLSRFDTRRIDFRSNDLSYVYSTIYLSKKMTFQPVYYAVQHAAECFFPKLLGLHKALVLGCAGCSIPRFLALRSRDCQITGVEYSEIMTEIAQKYFINDPIFDHFTLIRDDAFAFVQSNAGKYNYVYVDLFLAEKNHPKVLSGDFLTDLDSIMEKESIAIFNLLNLSLDDCIKFARRFLPAHSAAYVFDEQFHYYVAFAKTQDRAKLRDFELKFAKFVRIDERFFSDSP